MDQFCSETIVSGPGTALPPCPEPQVIELALHLPSWQVSALEEMAQDRGLSIGQLLRRLIANLVQEQAAR